MFCFMLRERENQSALEYAFPEEDLGAFVLV